MRQQNQQSKPNAAKGKGFSIILLALFFYTFCAIFSTDLEARSVSGNPSCPIELRGYLILGEQLSFSLKDTETGASWWMDLGESRFGFRIEQFDQSQRTVVVVWNGRQETIKIEEASGTGGAVFSKSIKLSPINQRIYNMSEKLIKPTRSEATGRLIRDHREVEKLRGFLAQNPSVGALHDFLPEMGDALDYDEFLELEFPKGMQSRNKQNTPRWGIDRSLDHTEIEQLIASSSDASQLEAALSEK